MSALAPAAKRARPPGLDARVSTLDLPTINSIFSLAVDKDGTTFVGTDSALYLITGGRVSLFAGSKDEAPEEAPLKRPNNPKETY